MTNAQPLPAISVNLQFAFCHLHCATVLGRELQCRSYMLPGAHSVPVGYTTPIAEPTAGFALSPTLINFGTACTFLDRRCLASAIRKLVGFHSSSPKKMKAGPDATCPHVTAEENSHWVAMGKSARRRTPEAGPFGNVAGKAGRKKGITR